jgi:hypothetical protein
LDGLFVKHGRPARSTAFSFPYTSGCCTEVNNNWIRDYRINRRDAATHTGGTDIAGFPVLKCGYTGFLRMYGYLPEKQDKQEKESAHYFSFLVTINLLKTTQIDTDLFAADYTDLHRLGFAADYTDLTQI